MADQTSPRKPNRRWLSFSLRMFLLILTLVAIALGWYVNRVSQQRAAVAWVVQKGGTVQYSFEFGPNEQPLKQPVPPGPDWLRNMLGIDYFSTVWRVNFEDINEPNLMPLAKLTSLKQLTLFRCNAADISPLAKLTNLKSLYIGNNLIRDITPLRSLKQLSTLQLNGLPI